MASANTINDTGNSKFMEFNAVPEN